MDGGKPSLVPKEGPRVLCSLSLCRCRSHLRPAGHTQGNTSQLSLTQTKFPLPHSLPAPNFWKGCIGARRHLPDRSSAKRQSCLSLEQPYSKHSLVTHFKPETAEPSFLCPFLSLRLCQRKSIIFSVCN